MRISIRQRLTAWYAVVLLLGLALFAVVMWFALYNRLVQVRWMPSMILEGHTGGHLGTAMPTFLNREVVPWLKP